MHYRTDPLWQRIEAFSLDDTGAAFPFSKKLAANQRWSIDFTHRAIEEYKKFIYLCCILPTGASPSPIVDEVWHLHLTYTINYWTHFCKETLHKDIHHHPSAGGAREGVKHDAWRNDTLKYYHDTFGTEPPADIWPVAKQETPITTNEKNTSSPIPWHIIVWFAFALPFLAIDMQYGQFNPFKLSGEHFLVFYTELLVVCLLVIEVYFQYRAAMLLHVLTDDIKDAGIYELAFLTGGKEKIALLLIDEVLEANILTERTDGSYDINKENARQSGHPLAVKLQYYQFNIISAETLSYIATKAININTARFDNIIASFNRHDLKKLLLAIIIAVGFFRCAQGVMNEKPISYLVCITLIGIFVINSRFYANRFHYAANRILRKNAQRFTHISQRNQLIIFAGASVFAPLAGLIRPQNKDAGSSDGGSSCSSDGGCGGGSGCGGCGGD